MIGKVNITTQISSSPSLSGYGTGYSIINFDHVVDAKVYNTTDSLVRYIMKKDGRDVSFEFVTDETTTQLTTLANATFASNLLALPVFELDNTSSAAVTHYIPGANILFGRAYSTDISKLWINKGGRIVTMLVDYNLDQITDIADTGTTTTTTTSA